MTMNGDYDDKKEMRVETTRWRQLLGTPVRSIIDEFLEKFQTAFEPPTPPFFGKNVAIFSKVMTTSTEFATKFFGSEMTPPYFKVFPEIHDQKCSF